MIRFWIACAVLSASLGTVNISVAQLVFSDDFNAENGGVGALNYGAFTNWSVSNGSVDLIGNSLFDFYSGNGLYVDLDGTSGDAGVLTSLPIALLPNTYVLAFDLGVNGAGANGMTVSLGSEYSEVFVEADAGAAPIFNPITRTFQVTSAGSLSLVFDHQGGDNFGLIIDNVRLSVLPEPATLTLFACAALAPLRRRRA